MTQETKHKELHGESWRPGRCVECTADAMELARKGIRREDIAEMARVYGVARFLGVTVEEMKAYAARRAGLWTSAAPEDGAS